MRRARGYTLVELVVVCAVLVILAGAAFPVAKYTRLRLKEMELRAALREMRAAIDEFKRYTDAGLLPVDFGSDGYPSELEVLVEPIDVVGQVDKQIRFLRRIPLDRRHRGKVDLPALRELLERRQWRARISRPAVAVR